jgi:hypothetical protein
MHGLVYTMTYTRGVVTRYVIDGEQLIAPPPNGPTSRMSVRPRAVTAAHDGDRMVIAQALTVEATRQALAAGVDGLRTCSSTVRARKI